MILINVIITVRTINGMRLNDLSAFETTGNDQSISL